MTETAVDLSQACDLPRHNPLARCLSSEGRFATNGDSSFDPDLSASDTGSFDDFLLSNSYSQRRASLDERAHSDHFSDRHSVCSCSSDGHSPSRRSAEQVSVASSVDRGGLLVPDAGGLHKFLPSNRDCESDSDESCPGPTVQGGKGKGGSDSGFATDQFRMFEFKVRKCTRARSHDWTECPFAHPGEKARRRDPRRFSYSGTPCPDFRKGSCRRGDACEYAHGVFECWLHPSRYRTQPCKDGRGCKRRVCFFAHSSSQLRLLPAAAAAAARGLGVDAGEPGSLSMDQAFARLEDEPPSSLLSVKRAPSAPSLGALPLRSPSLSPPGSPSVAYAEAVPGQGRGQHACSHHSQCAARADQQNSSQQRCGSDWSVAMPPQHDTMTPPFFGVPPHIPGGSSGYLGGSGPQGVGLPGRSESVGSQCSHMSSSVPPSHVHLAGSVMQQQHLERFQSMSQTATSSPRSMARPSQQLAPYHSCPLPSAIMYGIQSPRVPMERIQEEMAAGGLFLPPGSQGPDLFYPASSELLHCSPGSGSWDEGSSRASFAEARMTKQETAMAELVASLGALDVEASRFAPESHEPVTNMEFQQRGHYPLHVSGDQHTLPEFGALTNGGSMLPPPGLFLPPSPVPSASPSPSPRFRSPTPRDMMLMAASAQEAAAWQYQQGQQLEREHKIRARMSQLYQQQAAGPPKPQQRQQPTEGPSIMYCTQFNISPQPQHHQEQLQQISHHGMIQQQQQPGVPARLGVSRSMPSTPSPQHFWEPEAQGGRSLGAVLRSASEGAAETGGPDLGWVSDLVTEEQRPVHGQFSPPVMQHGAYGVGKSVASSASMWAEPCFFGAFPSRQHV